MKSEISGTAGRRTGRILFVLAMAVCVVGFTVSAAENEAIQVSLGGAATLSASNVGKLAVADPSVADVLPLSEKEISVIGKKAGETTLTVVYTDGKATKAYRVVVGNDPAAATIREMVGAPGLTVRAVGDSLVLDGQVDNELQSQRAELVAKAFKPQVVNLLEVKNPRQIKIKVRIAEVNITAARQMGLKWLTPNGTVTYGFSLAGVDDVLGAITHGGMSANVQLQWLETKQLARVLSEPILITRSGTEASFLAGQEVPIVQTLNNTSTVEFKKVGVTMKIKPVADSQGRINTTLHAEVSSIADAVIQGGTLAAGTLPIITSRSADTVLQLNDGQTLVIGGLFANNLDKDTLTKFPWLADIPIIGALFRHGDRSTTQRELLFFLTTEIVKDVDAEVAGAGQTPAFKKWNAEANQNVLPVQPTRNDKWGVHDVNTNLLPDRKPAAAEKLTPGAKPTANFTPARPAKTK